MNGAYQTNIMIAIFDPYRLAVTGIASLGLWLGPWSGMTVLAADEQIQQLMRTVEQLVAQNKAMAERLTTIESKQAARAAAAPVAPVSQTAQLIARIEQLEAARAEHTALVDSMALEKVALERRIRELETARLVQQDEFALLNADRTRLERRVAELEAPLGGDKPMVAAKRAAKPELERRVAELEEINARQTRIITGLSDENARMMAYVQDIETSTPDRDTVANAELEQRVKDLETMQSARDDATRLIIQDAMTSVGSNINSAVALAGTLEVAAAWTEDFDGSSAGDVVLNTAELDFEIAINDWVLGNMVIQYDDGQDVSFISTGGFEESVDRINLDTAFVRLGDPQRFPPYLITGRMILPFGISTGNPVADVLNIEDPLTIAGFEQRQIAIGFGLAWPTPEPAPQQPVVIPPVRPQLIPSMWRKLLAALGTEPPKTPTAPPTPVLLPQQQPTWNLGLYSFNGDTFDQYQPGWRPDDQINATIGYRTGGHCGKPYEELTQWSFCPWTLDFDLDYNSSVFDSRFMRVGYRQWLGDIGYVPGMAASAKTTFGPISLIGEWNGALSSGTFQDDAGVNQRLKPSAWQFSLGYQLDWNPWVEAIGAQGTYLAMSYSESQDFQGVQRMFGDELTRVGNLPRRRFQIGAGEWFMDGVKLSVEFSRDWDYPKSAGGTGRAANGIFSSLTYVW
ncbi:MAG: hypothetical protein N838_31450 [Thiohalocapsa sp. PB-PSB1]|jgi:cell division protein FtsB|nr:MAG: hypothetical protein N838_11370 [Thiohalocapsa sp. PB-PSB1]QQO57194.1 MAG: hypothetical protein N838_31450 [Thiohalocapsa sp. PB-PSB1]HCS89890.1 hypothetical protein [Chromatiaceae bacterium]